MAHVTVGIDIGTTSVKAVAADADGKIVASERIGHRLIAPRSDRFEHDPRSAWIDGVLSGWSAVSAGHEVAGVCVSAMVPSLCGVDKDGEPVTAGLLYGDARGRHESVDPLPVDALSIDSQPINAQPIDPVGESEQVPATGFGEVAGFAKWLGAQPEVAALWPAQAVANHALCGVGAIDTSSAMTMTPLFGLEGWDNEVLETLGLNTDQLPVTCPGHTPIARDTRAAASSTISADTVISGGTIDALAEQTVADAHRSGDVLVVCGTTLIIWGLTDEWREVEGLWTIPYAVESKSAIGGASNAGGLFIDRVRSMVGAVNEADLTNAAAGDLPVWVPYLRGERTPWHDSRRRAELLELGLNHGPAEITAAAYEASGFVVRHHLDLADVSPQRIVAVGGGTRSRAWMQALADCTNLAVDVSAHPHGAALGAAYAARVSAGLEADMSHSRLWARTSHRVEPRDNIVEAADIRYRKFRGAIE